MKILLIGRDTSITDTIEEVLSSDPDWTVEKISSKKIEISSESGKEKIRKNVFSVVVANLMDFSEKPVEVIRVLKTIYPAPPLLVLSLYQREKLIQLLLEAGAAGYLQLGSPETKLLQAINSMVKDKQFIEIE